ncbi:RNA polymerase, sigma subunit, RpoX/SigF [Pelagirhabdus alkalitolerans]|uniref:RNA polymerase sigma factor n=1 Tax=Pelagirhabdus alkalitolerans TaxID=1612202 RepID=A0A1G6HBT5_9BACI|nr:RNA polymerase sporulation sigma factor SigF [Pelagirhabdus alkalitolerans]SDB91730.1 RNA polymerase, sigma subunit, RpoX/SigF [Pelagirhabdus alkalitolerans]
MQINQVKKKPPLSDTEVKQLIKESQAGSKEAKDLLTERNVRLVWSVVQRFINRGYDQEDLFQIGCIGLLKSIDKFDLSYDVKFSTYAVPMIIGEIQRYIRDDGAIKVSRSLKELNHKVRKEKEALSKSLGRSPTLSEIACSLDLTVEQIIYAEESVRQPQSIHETVYENDGDPICLLDQLKDNDDDWFNHLLVKEVMEHLKPREQLIVYLRYFQDQTQSEVAKRLGISQVQVSRLEKKILLDLKGQLSNEA